MGSSAAKDLYVRVSAKDTAKAARDIRAFAKSGAKDFKVLATSVAPANRNLKVLNNVVREGKQTLQAYGGRLGLAGAALEGFGPAGLVAAAGVGAVTIGLSKSLAVAADVEEQMSQFNAVFKSHARSAEAWAREFAGAVNRSRYELMSYMATFQDTFVPLGYGRSEAAELSKQLTRLAVDLASFKNQSEPETVKALTSAIVGNHDAVQKYGIVITESTLKQELLNLGLAANMQKATEAQKVTARLSLIMRGTADAQGDAAATADSYTNTLRGMQAAAYDLGVTIGKHLTDEGASFNKFSAMMLNTAADVADYTAMLLNADTVFVGVGEDYAQHMIEFLERRKQLLETDGFRDFGGLFSEALNLEIRQVDRAIARYKDIVRSAADEVWANETVSAQASVTLNDTAPKVDATTRTRALKTIADMEERTAKASLSNLAWISRQRVADANKIAKLEKDGVIKTGEAEKARVSIKSYYNKKWLDEMERTLDEEQKQRKQAHDYVAKLTTRRVREEGDVVEAIKLDREKELKDLKDKEKKKLITVKQSAKARAEIEGYYHKKIEEATPSFSKQYNDEVDAYFDNLAEGGRRAGQFVVGAFQSMEDAFANFFLTGKFSASSFFDAMKVGLARLAAQDMIAGIGSALGLGGGKGGSSVIGSVTGAAIGAVGDFIGGFFAEGGRVQVPGTGLIRGPGTGTSDSIVARVSNKEYIVNARATERYLPLLEAINQSGLPGYARGGRIGANDNLPRFALGAAAESAGQAAADNASRDNDDFVNDLMFGGRMSPGERMARYGSPTGGPHIGRGGGAGIMGDPDNPNGRKYQVDMKGRITDTFGGSLLDRIGSFFGAGTTHGLLGSKGLGGLISIAGTLLGGPIGMLGALAANFTRARLTDGLAHSTGIGGMVSDLVSGRGFFGSPSSLHGGVGGGGLASSFSVTGGRDRDFRDIVRDKIQVDATPFMEAGLGGLRGRLASDYQPVVGQGARIMRGLRRGGRVAAGESVVVGEDDWEVFTPDSPGRISPRAEFPHLDQSEVVDALGQVVDELRRLGHEMERSNEQIAALSEDYAGRFRRRRSAA